MTARRFIIAAALCSLFLVARVQADILLDQQHTFTSSIANSTNGDVSEMGQSFTVGISGVLDHIDVYMFRLPGFFDPTGDPVLRIYNTSGGLPTGSALYTVSVSESLVPFNNAAFVTFDVSPANLAVGIGDQLAFSITAASGVGPYFIPTDQGQSIEYVGGAASAKFGSNPWAFISPPQDHSFRTYVLTVIPEPTGGLLLSLGFAIFACKRRRSRHSTLVV